jgi:hypothetical protein
LKKFEKYDETKYGARPNFFAFTCHHHQKGTTEEENEDEEEHENQS